MPDHGARWRAMSERIRVAWGPAFQWQIEAATGVASEILDRSKEAEGHVWEAALDEILTGPAPAVRSLPRLLAAALRRHVGAARVLTPTLTSYQTSTPYTRALAALAAGPCPRPVS